MFSHLDEICVIGPHYAAATCRRCPKVTARAGSTRGWSILSSYRRRTVVASQTDTPIGMRDSDALEIDLRENGNVPYGAACESSGGSNSTIPRRGKLTYLCICSPNRRFEGGNERDNSHKTKRNSPFTFLDSL